MSSETRRLSVPADGTATSYSLPTTPVAAYAGRAKRALVYSSAYLAVVTMIEVLVASVALSVPVTPAVVVGGLVTFAIYAHDRIADADTDAVSNPRQAAFARRHASVLYALASAAYGLAVAIAVFGGPLALAITLAPGIFGLLYSSDVLAGVGSSVSRLKDVFLVNSIVVSLAWAGSLTFLPLAYAGGRVTPAAGVVFAYFFLATFVNTEIPNVRDVDGDEAIGVATLPVVLGVGRTRAVLYAIDVVTVGLLVAAAATGVLAVPVVAALLVGLAYSLGVTGFLDRTARYGRLVIAAELEFAVVGAVLAAALLA